MQYYGFFVQGAPWRDLPLHYPAWKIVYDRFRVYVDQGIIDAALERLMLHANENRKILLSLIAIDGTYIKAHHHDAGAVKKENKPVKSLRKNKSLATPKEDLPPKSTGYATSVAIRFTL